VPDCLHLRPLTDRKQNLSAVSMRGMIAMSQAAQLLPKEWCVFISGRLTQLVT
jgi:hypothetical protein